METEAYSRQRGGLAVAAIAVGGAMGVAGSFLTWASAQVSRAAGADGAPRDRGRFPGQGLSGGQPFPRAQRPGAGARSFTINGLDTTAGRLVLAVFVALLVVAVVVWVGSRLWLRVAGIVAGLVLGVIALVLAATDLASPGSLFGVERDRLIARAIPVSAGLGLYLVLAGSIIAVGAAVWWLVANRRWWMGPEPALPQMAPAPQAEAPPSPADAPTTQLPPMTEPGLAEG